MATAEQTTSLGERVSRIEGGYEHLATKADLARVEAELAQMKAELKADLARVEADLIGEIGRLDGEIGGLRGDVRGIKWWLVSVGAAVVALSSLAQLLPFGG
ncbi:MAG: hypothetical protein OXK81_01490 [Chloroflexota bacterium]|nr:hypothetical protein [Chloroflexota bacterium]MDE2931342.1 hypothetical protein [Chloroflexota bacterium]